MRKNNNAREMGKILEELGSSFGSDNNFKYLCKHVWRTPYAFAHINYAENPPHMYHCFDRLIWDGTKPLEKMRRVQATSDAEDSSEDEVE